MTRRLSVLLLAAGVALGGCASAPAPACAPGRQAMTSELLYFGSAMPQGAVSPADWRAFADAEVTPRFPAGFSVWPAAGQWRGGDGAVVREASFVLNIVHAATPEDEVAIGAIVQAYRQRFHQESVLRVSSAACVAF
jgi:Protein of unknown function (DUF3574)